MLTISQLAAHVGVSVRTVRHYHQIGLLPEPERDSSGYRRYGTDAVIRLVRIRGLAAAGVPLTRVGELLEAGPAEFARAIRDVDTLLAIQIRELETHRARLTRTTDPDAGVLGPQAQRLLTRMAQWGLPQAFMDIQREAAVLISVIYPDHCEDWMRSQTEALNDPEAEAVYRLWADAHDWNPYDPRIEDLAKRCVAITTAHHPVDRPGEDWWSDLDTTPYQLIDLHSTQRSPAWRRLTRRVDELLRDAGYEMAD